MMPCRICQNGALEPLIDFGPQPLTNRYPASESDASPSFPLALAQCSHCGAIQLQAPPAVDDLRPTVDWISYREQEAHLDQLVDSVCLEFLVESPEEPAPDSDFANRPRNTTLRKLIERELRKALTPPDGKLVRGVTFKDESIVDRFVAKGFKDGSFLKLDKDFGISDPCAGLETIQAKLKPEWAAEFAASKGKADVLLVRHVLEHAHDIQSYASAIGELVAEDGLVVFEVPDCERGLRLGDFTLPWEEHVFYFTPETFQSTLGLLGFEIVVYECFDYPSENSLTAICRWTGASAATPFPTDVLERQRQLGKTYATIFESRPDEVRSSLAAQKASGGNVAVFGAGHLSAMYINLLGIADLIDFVVDDHPKKQGLLMPGSKLPILGSAALLERDVKVCLLSLSPDSEAKVVQKNQEYLTRGGVFASIFPGRSNSI